MKNLKTWLKEERGRALALARHLGLSQGRITQMASDGVPDKYKLAIREFTGGAVTLESMIETRLVAKQAASHATQRSEA